MPDDGRTPAEKLIDELWPCPEPPADMAERVLAALARDGAGPGAQEGQREKGPESPPAARPRRRGRVVAALSAAAAAAAVLGLGFWLASDARQAREDAADDARDDGRYPDGQLVAGERQTVSIGQRGAAAMEPGADLAWSVRGKRVRVRQRRGSVFYRVERGGPFRVATPGGEVEVTGTCFRITLPPGATAPASATTPAAATTAVVSVLEGSVKVRTDRGQLALSAGQAARLVPGRLPELTTPAEAGEAASAEELDQRATRAEARLRELETHLAQPAKEGGAPAPQRMSRAALLLPPTPRLSVHGDALDSVSLSLPQGRRNAGVEVARDRAFKHPVFSGPVHGGFVTVPAPRRGDLYWRLAGDPAPSGHARFLPEPARPGPRRAAGLRNLVSSGKETTTIYFQGAAPPELTLAFAPVTGAGRYRVRIYKDGALDRPVFQRVVTEPRCPVATGVLPEGRYLWNALPLDARDREVGGGRFNKLELVYDNALDGLAISRPRPGEVLTARSVEVAGVAPLGARLYVNGQPAPLDDKGRFSLRLGGTPRVLVFRLLGKGGAESYWVRRLSSRS